jgi:hypothetical protein
MRTHVWAWVWVMVIAGCRDLSLPTTDRLSVVLPFDSVAPRQKLSVTARGGAGSGYVFSFAPGGALSGPSASLTPEGEYQAGERGLAQDVLRVTDTAGNVAEARVAVGAPLTLTPPLTIVAPGGEVQFIAGGGQPPYVFTQGDGGLVTAGRFVADESGDRLETITVTDATNDALAFARAQVSVGSGLLVYPAEASLAPRETLAFVGLGGQPPYRFALSAQGSTGSTSASIDALTGRYQAGSNEADGGTSLDVVAITDRNGVTKEARITVGPALRATLPFTAQPGERLVIATSGGKAPFTFDFAPHGNRSNGTLDARTGAYVPGPTPLAVDRLQVTDATGTTVPLSPVTLGPLQLLSPWGRGGTQLLELDLDADQAPDLVSLNTNPGEAFGLLNLSRPTQSVVRMPTGVDAVRQLFPMGRKVLASGANEVFLYEPTPSGALSRTVTSTVGIGGPSRSAWDGARYLYRAARFGPCVGLERLDGFRLAGTGLTEAQCLVSTTATPLAIGTQGTPLESYVYWLADPAGLSGSSSPGPIQFHYFAPTLNAPTITRTAQLALPAGTVLGTERANAERGVNQLLDDPRELGPDRVLALLSAADGGTAKLWGFAGSGPTPLFAPIDLPLPQPAVGIAVTAGPPSLVGSWDGFSGQVLLHELQPDGGVAQRQRLDVPASVTAATFADVNQDEVKDLVTSDARGGAHVLLFGEGDGTFSRRPRFRVTSDRQPTQLADLDGDGAVDVLSYSADTAQVFWGSTTEPAQLAAGPRSRLGATARSVLVTGGAGQREVVFTDERGGAFVAAVDASGALGTPRRITSSAGDVETSVLTLLFTADLGGAALGPDFLAYRVSGEAFALIRDGETTAHLVPIPLSGPCDLRGMQLDGQGAEELVIACLGSVPDTMVLSTSRLQGNAFTAPTPVTGATAAGAYRGFLQAGDGSWWLQTTQRLYRVTAQAGSVMLDGAATSTSVFGPQLAQLDPASARPQLVGITEGDRSELVVQAWNGTSWIERQRLRVGVQTALSVLRRGPGKPDDVLLQTANGDVFVLTNDGTGTLR